MSDDFDFADDQEEYDFEYEEDDEEQPDADLENRYYAAKALKEEGAERALEAFEQIVAAQDEPCEWYARRGHCDVANQPPPTS
jgi:COP9 signalosome complex subunit 2